MKASLDVRPSPIAGRWYPANPESLAASVDRYMDDARLPVIDGEIVGVVAPHAGHLYSGPVAGYSFAALRGLDIDLAAVISPMHHPYFQALLTTGHEAYATPLGTVPVDQEAVTRLDQIVHDRLGFGLDKVYKDPEHSLEIELPFLQRASNHEFRLLPVMVRDQSAFTAQVLGEGLAEVLKGQKAVLVASTDLSHFYTQAEAKILDSEMLDQIKAFNPQGVLEVERQGKGFACGKAAVAAVLWAAKQLGANQVQLLHYGTSGDITGDHDQVVGYGSAVITRLLDK
jgi:AmmeMemoRadiSam system protein B